MREGAPGAVPVVHVYNRQRALALDLPRLRATAAAAVVPCMERRGPGTAVLTGLDAVEASVVSDRVIARVHRRFLNVPGATDVITFPHGEIVLSAATAARQADEHGETHDREVARYLVHGLLHLNGHEDATPADAAAMWEAQEMILQSIWPRDDVH